jgi:hypothetical protein
MPEGFDKNSRPGVMSRFRVHELSGVDVPAQVGARAVILKAASPPEGDDPGLPQIDSREQLVHHVGKFGQVAAGDRPKMKAHLVARAQALGVTDVLPDSWADAAQQVDPDAGDDAENSVDKVIKALMAKGAAIRKAAGEDPDEDLVAGADEVGDVDWADLRKANLGNIAKAAKERFAADPSKSIEKHYAEALASPNGGRAYAFTR